MKGERLLPVPSRVYTVCTVVIACTVQVALRGAAPRAAGASKLRQLITRHMVLALVVALFCPFSRRKCPLRPVSRFQSFGPPTRSFKFTKDRGGHHE